MADITGQKISQNLYEIVKQLVTGNGEWWSSKITDTNVVTVTLFRKLINEDYLAIIQAALRVSGFVATGENLDEYSETWLCDHNPFYRSYR